MKNTNAYDPILRARKLALEELDEELSVDDYEVAMAGIDKMLDMIEYVMANHAGEVTWNDETGTIKILGDKNSS